MKIFYRTKGCRVVFRVCMVFILAACMAVQTMESDPSPIRQHLDGALSSAENMVLFLQEGQKDEFKKEAGEFILHAKKVIQSVPDGDERGKEMAGHLKMAVMEGEEAMKASESGNTELAENRALSAYSHAEEANSLSDGF